MSTDKFPKADDTVRVDVIYSWCVIERDSNNDDKIKLTYVTNMNLFLDLPNMVIEPFVSKAAKAWFENV
jgi:hypothetical protein